MRQARGIYLKGRRVCPAEGGRAKVDAAACAVCHREGGRGNVAIALRLRGKGVRGGRKRCLDGIDEIIFPSERRFISIQAALRHIQRYAVHLAQGVTAIMSWRGGGKACEHDAGAMAAKDLDVNLRKAGRQCHLRERAAAMKRMAFKGLHPFGQFKADKAGAILERTHPNGFHRAGDFDGCERAAVLERIFPNALQPLGQRGGRKASAAVERAFPYTRHRSRNIDGCKRAAVPERSHPDALQPLGQRDVLKSGAAVERTCPYACYRRRDLDGRKAAAASERVAANAFQPVGQRDVLKAGAPAERVFRYACIEEGISIAVRLVQLLNA